ncbi:MAG: site-2 protease family protein [Nitrospirae bacterium]|nr:site-2 protease family protein [Nitrospirota bacterium]
MNAPLQFGSLKIATIMGIPIRIHFSWLIVFGILTWSLSAYYFPQAVSHLTVQSYWITGAVAALLLFVSVALHELSHSFVALRYKLPIISITLFIFGGVSQMKGEPPDPRAEFNIAIAGPLTSFLLSLVFFAAYRMPVGEAVKALFAYLSQLNLMFGLFNLVPGFPMDGGRVVRSFIWHKTSDFFYATRKAASYGQKIALLIIFLGFFSAVAGMSGGLWLMLIGWFLHSSAQASYQQVSLQETLSGIKVENIMVRDIVTMPPDLSLDDAVNDYFLKYGYGGFPVVEAGRLLGFISLKEIRHIPRTLWKDKKVADFFLPYDRSWEVDQNSDAMKALESMISEDKGRLAVVKDGSIIGLITRNGIAKYIQIMAR